MSINLPSIFTRNTLKEVSSTLADIISLNYGFNKKTGEKFARAVLKDGRTLIKSATKTGVEINQTIVIPAFRTVAERNNIIKDLYNNKHLTQELIASMMDISQSTVSNVIRKK